MDIKQLRYFAKIAELGNMTRAAQALHIAQPALSQQLANLEDELGVRLLERGVWGARLTPPGDYVYAQARSLMRQVAHIKTVLAREPLLGARVTVGMPSSMGRLLGEPLVRHFVEERTLLLDVAVYPSSDLMDLVAAGRIDVAIATDAAPRKGVLVQPVLTEDLLAVLAPRFAHGRDEVTLAQLAELPMLMSGSHTMARRVEEAFHRQQLRPRVVAEIGGTDMLVRLVAAGVGCAVLPFSGVDPDALAAGRLLALPIRDGAMVRTLNVCESEAGLPGDAARMVRDQLLDRLTAAAVRGDWRGCRLIDPSAS